MVAGVGLEGDGGRGSIDNPTSKDYTEVPTCEKGRLDHGVSVSLLSLASVTDLQRAVSNGVAASIFQVFLKSRLRPEGTIPSG